MTYLLNNGFHQIYCGFQVNTEHILTSLEETSKILTILPSTLYKSIDYKTTSSIIGAIFCHNLANATGTIVNPIEKGHPDLIPKSGENASEEQLRNYPYGIEIKCTIGNIKKGKNLRAGTTRINDLIGITWQAHHQEVRNLLGLIWDFVQENGSFNYPKITGVFYCDNLVDNDWGAISGTSGRNTKVTSLTASGKLKMGQGWIALLNHLNYINTYQKLLKFEIR